MACGSGKADGRVDADTAIGGFLDGRNAGGSCRNFYDHVGSEFAELDGLREIARESRNRRGSVWIESRPFLPCCCVEDWFENARGLNRDFADQLPGELVFGGGGKFVDQLADADLPGRQFFFQYSQHDDGIAGGADGAMSIEYVSSAIDAESFHRQVGVVCVI